MSHITLASPHIFQNSFGLSSAPATVTLYIFSTVAVIFLQIADGTGPPVPVVDGITSTGGWSIFNIEISKRFGHCTKILEFVTNNLLDLILACLKRLTSSAAAALMRARRSMLRSLLLLKFCTGHLCDSVWPDEFLAARQVTTHAH